MLVWLLSPNILKKNPSPGNLQRFSGVKPEDVPPQIPL
ncbi:hypothetical protein FB599_4038 [Herbaspirillum sp. SJZ130]|nr:hypothetical protein [Herbaspirillum sp. SJZ102]TQK00075.1 hypothetical protein FB599_4038 [Herbaspirillum sp. SJZ130]TQK04600.1 hypothetical protein FB598_3922 [Herbaspirillum sp. SJZ106]